MRFLFSLCLVVSGCALISSDEETLTLRTDDDVYFVGEDDRIELRVRNETDDPVYYICTGQIFVEEWEGSRRIGRWMVHGFEECLRPVPIEPDDVEVFSFDLRDDPSSILNFLDGARLGESVHYRFTMDLFEDDRFRHSLSEDETTSNRYKLMR